MYYLYGLDYHRQNLEKLLRSAQLKKSYDDFIAQHSVFETPLADTRPKVINFLDLNQYAPHFCKKNSAYFSQNPSGLDHKIQSGYFESALDDLQTTQPELYDLTCFYMKIIVINYLARYIEGTTDDSLGLSCMDFKNHFEVNDFYELLFHQIVHKMTFIDNRLHPQLKPEFKDDIIPTSFVHKGGGNDFSLYMVFHSFLVGVEILYYRRQTQTLNFAGNYHGKTEDIVRKVKQGAALLKNYKACFTSHGWDIVCRADHFLHTTPEETFYGNGHIKSGIL